MYLNFFHNNNNNIVGHRDGNREGWDQRMWSSLPPCIVLSCAILASPCPAWWEKLPYPITTPQSPGKAPPHSVKFYFVLICPTIITTLFNKTCIININIFEITTKFIPSNQTNFKQKLNNKCLTRQYHNKNKYLNIHAFKFVLVLICLFKVGSRVWKIYNYIPYQHGAR